MKNKFLSNQELAEVLDSFSPNEMVNVVRIRYKNKKEIRTQESIRVEDLQRFFETCIEDRHQPGGDLELEIRPLGKLLVGHHDGLYWLEPLRTT